MSTGGDDLFDELLREAVHDASLLAPGSRLVDGRLEVRRLRLPLIGPSDAQ